MKARHPGCHRQFRGQRGAVLLLILIIAMTVGMALLFRDRLTPEAQRSARDERTDQILLQARAALIGYAATYREKHLNAGVPDKVFGYLPCPDLIGDGDSSPTCGQNNVADGKPAVGLLPYKALDLPDLRDQDGICLWYVVSGNFKAHNKRHEPMNWDTQGQIAIRDANTIASGTPVVLTTPGDAVGGAAAVIIAVGAPLAGQNRTPKNKTCGVDPVEVAAYLDGGYDFTTTVTLSLNQGVARDGTGTVTNNDRMVWISPKEIFAAVKRRSDFAGPAPNGHLNQLINDLVVSLKSGATLPTPSEQNPPKPDFTDTEVGAGAAVLVRGVLPTAPALVVSRPEYLANWRDQFLYLICKNRTKCLNGGTCAGALLFGGARTADGPRPATDTLAARGAAMLEGDYLRFWNGEITNSGPDNSYVMTTPGADVVRCLNPQPSVLSFSADMPSLAANTQVVGYTEGRTVSSSTETSTLTLGNANLSSSQENPDTGADYVANLLFGCAWFGTPAPVTSKLVAYFRFSIANLGSGFTFALAEANPLRNPDTAMCGNGGSSLGYSGLPNGGAPIPGLSLRGIQFPKLGLEFDTRKESSASNDPDDKHVALVFWNDPISGDRDNRHGDGINPAEGSQGVADDVSFLRQTSGSPQHHVRLEIKRSRPTGTQTQLAITAWVFSDAIADSDPTLAATLANTELGSDAVAELLAARIATGTYDPDDYAIVQRVITINDFTTGSEAMRNLWVGFTNGTSSDAQVIQITDFILNSQ